MKTISRCLPLVIAGLCAPSAHAVGLGQIHTYSALGNRLQAAIDLYASPSEQSGDWQVEILPDRFADAGSAPATVIAELRARVTRSPQGLPYIQIESAGPVDYSLLNFRVRISQGEQGVTGRYALNLAPVALPVAPRVERPRRAPAKAPRAAVIPVGANTYGPVRSGESLWTIAHRIAGAGDANALLQKLHEQNPQAFVGGDINRLRVGAVLVLDGAHSTASKPAATLTAEGQPNALATAPETAQVPAPVVALPAAAPVASGSGNPRLIISRALSEDDPALAARLHALDEKFAAIRARYAAASAPPATLAATPNTLDAIPAAAAAAPIAGSSTPAPAIEVAAPAKPVAATTPTAAKKSAPLADASVEIPQQRADRTDSTSGILRAVEQVFGKSGTVGLTLLGASLLVGAGLIGGRRLLGRRTQPAGAGHDPVRDATLKAEVMRKSENRVRLENEIKALVKPGSTPDYRPGSTVQLQSAPLPLPLGAASDGNTSDIDASIANGFYTEAEQMLRRFIEKNGASVTAKLRLAEVLYITEQAEAFAEIAQDMMAKHRKDVSDDDWQRVIRMGKMIAPDYPLFSGPRQVGMRA